MVYTLDMVMVDKTKVPHKSHDMGNWASTVVACASNDRFGEIRSCSGCGGRHVEAGGPGSQYMDKELLRKCEAID